MVSLHTILELENSSKKRKRDDPEEGPVFGKKFKHPEDEKSIFDIELHLETPLPLDWQRCLDIKSGNVYFYNTRTKERTSSDPRKRLKERSSDHRSHHMSLDLELNLSYESLNTNQRNDLHQNNDEDKKKHNKNANDDDDKRLTDTRSWLAFDKEDDQQEMVAAVCKKCFMLVMLFKSSPTCPNCKFMNPQQEHSPKTTSDLFMKKRLIQLLY